MLKSKGYFITGTDTNVGKTIVTACLLTINHKRGIDTGVMKPVETGVDQDCSSEANSDANFFLKFLEIKILLIRCALFA